MPPIIKVLVGSVVALSLYCAATYVGWEFEQRDPAASLGTAGDLIYLPTPRQAQLMSLGFTNVVADYYWVKALQYYTDPTQMQNRYKNLADYLDVVVGVDPDYEYAYKFAGLAVPYDKGRWHHVNTRRSTSILERGVERFPANWQLHFILGYNYLNFHEEPKKAAEQFEAAARLPGSPAYLAAFAARVYAVGGEIDRALDFAKKMLETTSDPEIASLMRARIKDLEVERELRRIEAGAKAFQEKTGKLPASLAELNADGFTPPPAGYSLDATGVAQTTLAAERMVIHVDPNQAGFRGD